MSMKRAVVVVTVLVCLMALGASSATAQVASPWDYISVFNQTGEEAMSWEQHCAAVRALVQMGETAVGPLLSVVNHQNPVVRTNAALALGRIGAQEAVDKLVGMLQDPEESVRGTAAEALGSIGDFRAIGPLLVLLRSDDEANVRGAEVAMGTLKAGAAAQPLIGLLTAENWEIRWRAAVSLGKIGNAAAVQPLTTLAEDENSVVAACAKWALGAIADEADLSALVGGPQRRKRDRACRRAYGVAVAGHRRGGGGCRGRPTAGR